MIKWAVLHNKHVIFFFPWSFQIKTWYSALGTSMPGVRKWVWSFTSFFTCKEDVPITCSVYFSLVLFPREELFCSQKQFWQYCEYFFLQFRPEENEGEYAEKVCGIGSFWSYQPSWWYQVVSKFFKNLFQKPHVSKQ